MMDEITVKEGLVVAMFQQSRRSEKDYNELTSVKLEIMVSA